MKSTRKCPICNNQVEYIDFYDDYYKVEEHIRCNHCGYFYDFAYGACREHIGNKEFVWSHWAYNDRCAFSRLSKKMARAEFMARRNWKKGLRK